MRGFTLVEMMITMTVAALILLLGAPALSSYIENARIRAAAEQMKEAAVRARSEAIKRNATVVFAPQGTGWQTYRPGVVGGEPEVLHEQSPANAGSATVSQSGDSIGFSGSGRVAGLASLTLDFRSRNRACAADGGEARCLRLVISAGGQVRLCDPALSTPDPRACGA